MMNTQTFVRYEERDGGGYNRLYTCRNQLCDRLTTAMFCCPGCAAAHGLYEIDDTPGSRLGHSDQCDERHARRSAP